MVKFPGTENRFSGGSDVFDNGLAGQIISKDFFPEEIIITSSRYLGARNLSNLYKGTRQTNQFYLGTKTFI